MADIEGDDLIICIHPADGSTIQMVQESLILAIEKISESETSECEDHKNAVFWLSNFLRQALLDDSQTNIGLGGKPYKKKGDGNQVPDV